MPDRMPFRQRAREVSRIEAFSDVVFGFALTLIVISLEVPETYAELMQDLRGFPGFAVCFGVLTWIWWTHHTFFRRYAMHDGYTILLNTVLLFLVLLYVYPLKFLFGLVTGAIHAGPVNAATLFVLYGLGFAGIFALFLLLHVHAYRRREELELNDVEIHDTRSAMILYAAYVVIGLLSTLIAVTVPRNMVGWAGWTYFLLGPVSGFIGARRGAKRRAVEEAAVA